MKLRSIAIFAMITLLAACANPPPPQGYNVAPAQASLAEASYSVSRSIVDLAEVAQAARPLPNLGPPPNPATYGMGGSTTLDWSGPVEPLVRQIAKATNYHVRVLGTPPSIPIIITIFEKNIPIGDILRDVGYQCGRRASIVVYPASSRIELRYAKN